MEDLANNLLATLKKTSASIDSKIQLFNTLKSKIKHEQVPESAESAIVDCVRIAIASQISSSLVTTGFSTLSHLTKRLTLQDQMNVLFSKRVDLLTLLLERLGDQKEVHRNAAMQALCDLWSARPVEVEKVIRDDALLGSNVRSKEMGLQWVTKMHFEQGLQFRTFVPPMVACLEDADGMIREAAKTNIVELFKNARDAAKADLKRQLTAYSVRKSIATYILSQLQVPGTNGTAGPRSETPSLEQSAISDNAAPAAPSMPPSAEATHIEPYYVHTARDLEDEFRKMAPAFEGKESEENWKPRDANVLKIRRMLKGNAPEEHMTAFIIGIKGVLDGILKVVKSLRTTMSVNGCSCIQELARTLGSGLDPMVEIILQAVDPLCASTKNIAAQNGNNTVDIVLSNVTYHVRLMQHIWNSCNDKNVQPKIFAAGWLKSVMKSQSSHKGHFEHSGGLELAEKCIKKGLSDPNPKVRESIRSAYWTFAQIWVDRGNIIMENLDAKSKSLLEKDPSNPNRSGGSVASLTSSVGPGGASNPRTAAPRTTLKDTIAAQKRAALAAKKMPDRPNSAMSTFTSPVKASQPPNRPPTGMSHNRTGSAMSSHAPSRHVATKPAASSVSTSSQNSLMSGPIRRPRRPDVPRPATADPYANRKNAADTPRESPVGSPRLYARGSVANMQSGHAKSKSTTTARVLESGRTSRAGSPKISPVRVKEHPEDAHFHSHLPRPSFGHSSPTSKDENLTVARPESGLARRSPFAASHRNSVDRPGSSHSPLQTKNAVDKSGPSGETGIKSPIGAISSSPPKRDTPIKNLRHQRTQSQDVLRGMSEEPASVGQSRGRRRDSTNVKSVSPDERNGNAMHVYEDPNNESHEAALTIEARDNDVLEELPLNEQMQQAQPVASPLLLPAEQTTPGSSERRLSSAKKGVTTYVDRLQDHADILKTRRQLTGGTKQIRSKECDAHVFRKLQELVKGHIQNAEVRFADLLTALLGYLETRSEELKVSASKAHGLKLQALTTTRAILVLHHRDEDVRKLYSQALCAMAVAKSLSEPASHMASDVDKAMDEVLQYLEDRLDECIDAVSNLVETESERAEPSSHGIVTVCLKVLSKLMSQSRDRNEEVNMLRRRRLGSLAVQFLGHADSDVRKADTEFCIELYQLFGESHKREFWSLLEAAPESQQNLVAYYITRKGKTVKG